jgi:S1-C subfamily serine protease
MTALPLRSMDIDSVDQPSLCTEPTTSLLDSSDAISLSQTVRTEDSETATVPPSGILDDNRDESTNKRRRTESLSSGDRTPSMSIEDDIMDGAFSAMQPAGWQETIERAVKAIVSIRFSQVAAFDTESAETSEASGFIVDAERGIILTNR